MQKKNNPKKELHVSKKKHNFIHTMLAILCFLMILVPGVYLVVSRVQLNKLNTESVTTYTQKKLSAQEIAQANQEKDEYNKKLLEGAFNSEITSNISPIEAKGDDTVLGVVYIPRLKETIPLYYGSKDTILAKGAGIMEKTSLPGGKGTNCVITAHRGTHNGQFFRYLNKLEQHDPVYIYMNKEVLKYEVGSYSIIKPHDARLLGVDPNRDQITLLTCTPYLINTERLLYFGDRVPIGEEEAERIIAMLESGKSDDSGAEKDKSLTETVKNTINKFGDNPIDYIIIATVFVLGINILFLLFGLYFLRKKMKEKDKIYTEEDIHFVRYEIRVEDKSNEKNTLKRFRKKK